MNKIAIIGGRIIDPESGLDQLSNLYLQDGKVIAISNQLEGFEPEIILNAKEFIVCPGLVDINANILSSYLNQQTFTAKLATAEKAGITHFATYGFTPDRCLVPQEIAHLSGLGGQMGKTKIYFIGALTQDLKGERLNELQLFKDAGCIGFTNGYYAIPNTLTKRRCYDYAAMLGLKIYMVLDDPYLSKDGCIHEGEVSARFGLNGIPTLAESLGLLNELLLIENTGITAHFYRLSSQKSIEILENVDRKNITFSADVAIHQLFLTDKDVELFNGYYHVRPPFRTLDDKISLRKAIKTGIIQAISSDHITLSKQVKEVPFQESAPGIASWPLLLPLTLKLAQEEDIPLVSALKQITTLPAKILGIDAGHLRENAAANIVVFDPHQRWLLSEDDLLKFGGNNPFASWQLQGQIRYTLIDGQLVYENA